jgi:exodeoxyribonuclease V beta subunit
LLGGLQERGLRFEQLISVIKRLDADPALELDSLPAEVGWERPLAPQLDALWPQRWQHFVDLWHQQAEALEQAFCATAADLRARFGPKAIPSGCNYSAKPRTNRVDALNGWIAEQERSCGLPVSIEGGMESGEGGLESGSPSALPGYRAVVKEKLLREYFHPGPFTRMVAPYEDGPISLPQRPLLEAIAELVDGPLELTVLHFGHWARQELLRRRQRSGRMGFAQLLEGLDPGPSGQEHGALIAALGRRYRVALVDEFQDTDPIQWRILRLAFAEAAHQLVMVGDPKQAIYRFRGGDLATYLQARRQAAGRFGLIENRRATAELVEALNGLMGPAGLKRSGLAVPAVRPRADRSGPPCRQNGGGG